VGVVAVKPASAAWPVLSVTTQSRTPLAGIPVNRYDPPGPVTVVWTAAPSPSPSPFVSSKSWTVIPARPASPALRSWSLFASTHTRSPIAAVFAAAR
jgi:hypothetical protein